MYLALSTALRHGKRKFMTDGPGRGYAFGFTGPGESQALEWERVVYRVSGGVILTCVILIYPLSAAAAHSLLVLETIMLVSFGLSWFVKGRKILSGG
jgi:hypothetical protein